MNINPRIPSTDSPNSVPAMSNKDNDKKKHSKSSIIQGSSAAGTRALGTQIVAFYFRAPVKAFFRTRVDYMTVARAINPAVLAQERWSLRQSTPGLLVYAVREHGWGFIPRQVLPPLFANTFVGAVLYTSYLQVLGALHQPSSQGAKRAYPPPPASNTFVAGFAAGTVQSVVAAPLDALVVRFKVADMLEGNYKSMVGYAKHKLAEIGVRGVFAGYSLSFLKEAFGYGCFFSAFEFVKQQAYFSFLGWYYGGRSEELFKYLGSGGSASTHTPVPRPVTIRPHYTIEPIFLLLAGASASVTQQLIQHPISKIQEVHYGRLESLDYASKLLPRHGTNSALNTYGKAYYRSYKQCALQATKTGGWRRFLFRGLVMNTLRQIPSTSAGLIVFELARRKFGEPSDGVVAIEFGDRSILLS